MKWMRERDLLIAQTMAFVQSVTGKTPEAEKTITASVALLSVETSEKSSARPRPFPTLRRCWRRRRPLPRRRKTFQETYQERNAAGDIEAGSPCAS